MKGIKRMLKELFGIKDKKIAFGKSRGSFFIGKNKSRSQTIRLFLSERRVSIEVRNEPNTPISVSLKDVDLIIAIMKMDHLESLFESKVGERR